jgi:Ca2+-binding EF-hand superfamily protein
MLVIQIGMGLAEPSAGGNMQARQVAFALFVTGCSLTAFSAPGFASAAQQGRPQQDRSQYDRQRWAEIRQRQTQFREMDRDDDGVVTREEWRGNREDFNRIDRNNDGVISLGEFIDEGSTVAGSDRRPFNELDRNGNGVITSGEWTGRRDEFRALDTDNDGVISRQEYRQWRQSSESIIESPAYRAGRERGLTDGRQAGREDRTVNGGKWDLDGQRELENADAGYSANLGPRADYQAGYRDGFRNGYREGFGPR